MWPYSTCHMRLVCYSWLSQGVGEIYTLIDEGGRCSLTAADRESAAQETGSVSEILMRQLPFLVQQKKFIFNIRFMSKMSLVQCYASVCFIKKKALLLVSTGFRGVK